MVEKFCFVFILLEFGVYVDGLLFCEKLFLLVVLEIEEFGIVNELIEVGVDVVCVLN